ncbi:WD40-repeat-containing domain protein [Tuber brumale]|nr:WD40-repeat-containing domain protein [Tuber brumale]
MATTAVQTPVKSHSNIFSTRAAGGRMPLTPSPRGRNSPNNASPFTPPARRRHHDPSWHADPPRKANLFGDAPSRTSSSLTAAFASLNVSGSSKSRSSRVAPSPKSNIARSAASPLRLDLGVSDWALTGTGTTAGQTPIKRKTRSGTGKTTIRINGDRFIPTRGASSPTASSKIEHSSRPGTSHGRSNSVLSGGVFGSDDTDSTNSAPDDTSELYQRPNTDSREYESSIAAACGVNLTTRILAFKPSAPESSKPIDLRSQYNRPLKPAASATQVRRRILTAPERVLDAPGLVDDYYLNLLDWSSSNQVAIGLERHVYVWNADTGNVNALCETSPDTYVTSVKWSGDGAYIALGLDSGDVQIWDVEDQAKLRTMGGHHSRVGVMSWNKAILSTGSRSGNIFNHDVRIAEHKTAELLSHTSEVCGLEWRSDGAQLASGGNDNLVNIWDARSIQTPKWTKTNHKAAVKALAWCPWQLNLLATGGGNYDRCIHFWNSTTGARVNSIDTGSQVTSLKWSTNYRELVSCHGMPDNQLNIWSYPNLVRNVEIPAHETRILHSALSPDGQTLATCASDENLKFWKLFEKRPGSSGSAREGSSITGKGSKMAKQMTIR